MKKVIAIIALLACLIGWASAEGQYIRFGNIIDIEYDTDFVTVDDGLGNLWDFYSYSLCAYNFYGDLVVMIMSDNGTPTWIFDDKVINAYPCTLDEANELIRTVRQSNEERQIIWH